MSKVSLRVYTRDIEGMIEAGQIDESVAHGLHILKTFPMHLETYRLLGKAFLEGKQYANAADIFRRILMAVPDDFVSHVGMSIIADDESRLDDAIWHMERAFEVQPSNPAIQGELRRLYGRREGVEPPKIRLTRDALANMYAQGELYNQAIAEIRAVLAEDTARPDLQVMLARAYFRANQKVEATEMCSSLLKKYPYCFDALRILTEILPGTGREDNTQVFRHRINALDPYAAFATTSVFQSDKVPDAAVNLERLDYEPGFLSAASQPDWASSLGIKLEEPVGAKPAPEWLRSPTDEAAGDAAKGDELPRLEAGQQDEIPDWMRSAGWAESTGATVEGSVDFGENDVAEPIAQGDIPDWLKSMAPPEALAESIVESETESDVSDLFGDLVDHAGDKELPDWLRSSEAGATKLEGALEPEPTFEKESVTSQGDVPDWLKSLTPEAKETASELEQPEKDLPEEPTVDKEDVPDWMKSLQTGAMEPISQPEQTEQNTDEEPIAVSDSMPDWLKDLAPEGEMPEPIDELIEESLTEESPVAEPTEAVEKTVDAHSGEVSKLYEGTLPSMDDQDAALAWLESLAAKQGAKEEELLTKPEDRLETAPDWVQKLSVEEASKPVAQEPGPAEPVEEEIEEEGKTEVPSEAEIPLKEGAPDWLASLGEPEEFKGEEEFLTTESEAIQEEPVVIPESQDSELSVTSWLQNLEEEEKQETHGEDTPVESADAGLPDWLSDLGQPAGRIQEAGQAEQPPDWARIQEKEADTGFSQDTELPEWLSGSEDVDEKPVEPVTSQDWMPAEDDSKVEESPVPQEQEDQLVATDTPGVTKETAEQVRESTLVASPSLTVPDPTGVLSRIPLQERESDLLVKAQDALQQGKLDESMDIYVRLIKKGRLLDEVIHDLHEAVYRFPVDMIIWQTLGDAYMRANRLQEALDAYTKAEELLR